MWHTFVTTAYPLFLHSLSSCTVSYHHLSHSPSSETFTLQLFVSALSLSQGDLNESASWQFSFIFVVTFLLSLSFVPVRAYCADFAARGRLICHCQLPQGFASMEFSLSTHTFTHPGAYLVIAGLQCSKLEHSCLPLLVLFNPRLACSDSITCKVCLFSQQMYGCSLVRNTQPSTEQAILRTKGDTATAVWSSRPWVNKYPGSYSILSSITYDHVWQLSSLRLQS